MGKPFLPNLDPILAAGINPKTNLPYKMGGTNEDLKNDVKKILRIIDEQDAVNRYVWYNLPCNLTGQELERMLYYKGQLAFFYIEDLDEFYFMPYALDGTIDFYGRYNTIHPVPMTSGTAGDDKAAKAQADYLSTLKLKCVYGLKDPDTITYDDLTHSAVLLSDYTKQMSQTTIARQQINDPLLDTMAETIPYLRTALMVGTGIKGVRVQDADQQAQVEAGSRSVKTAALNGNPWVSFIGNVEFQDLTDGALLKAEEYMMSLQSLDNFRLSTYGIEKGGVYEKDAYQNNKQVSMNAAGLRSPYQDGLSIRQNFCVLVNSLWNLGIWCEASENETALDQDNNGALEDTNADGSKSGVSNDNGGQTDGE